METIVRKAIKLRTPIQLDYCDCWGVKILSANGIPYLSVADGTPIENIRRMLELEQSIGYYFSEPIEDCMDKVLLVLSQNIPVTIKTNKVLPDKLLQMMHNVAHSSIHVSINYLDERSRLVLDPGSDSLSDMKEMLFNAKSLKIFTVLTMKYIPHLVPRLDVYEIIDMVKNQVSHMTVEFPVVSDQSFYSTYKSKWEAHKPSSLDLFRQYFTADVPSRAWEVRPKYKKVILKELQDYIKDKKIGIEVMNLHESNNRIRHALSGMSELPLGMRPFWYQKEEGIFKHTLESPKQICPMCQKPIFS